MHTLVVLKVFTIGFEKIWFPCAIINQIEKPILESMYGALYIKTPNKFIITYRIAFLLFI